MEPVLDYLKVGKPERYQFSGFILLEFNQFNMYLYTDPPKRNNQLLTATEKILLKEYYDLVFRINDYPDFWFLLKDEHLSVYSFESDSIIKEFDF